MELEKLVPRPARVVRVVDETLDTKTYYLVLRHDKLDYKPGMYVMVYVWGLGEIPISISNIRDLDNNYVEIGLTIRASGTISRYIFEHIGKNSILGIRGPYGNGWNIEEYIGWHILVIAGGIGLAPLRPLIKYVIDNKDLYPSLTILYGAKTPEYLIYRDELWEWSRIEKVNLLITVDKPEGRWNGYTGFVTDLIDKITLHRNTVAYICGPEIMMKKAIEKLLLKKFDSEHIYLSLERRMRCGIGICGTCQFGHYLICIDGPVFRYSSIKQYLQVDGI